MERSVIIGITKADLRKWGMAIGITKADLRKWGMAIRIYKWRVTESSAIRMLIVSIDVLS